MARITKREALEAALRAIATDPGTDAPFRVRVDDLLAMEVPPPEPRLAVLWHEVRSPAWQERMAQSDRDYEEGKGVVYERPDLPRKVIFSPQAIRDLANLDLDEEIDEGGASDPISRP